MNKIKKLKNASMIDINQDESLGVIYSKDFTNFIVKIIMKLENDSEIRIAKGLKGYPLGHPKGDKYFIKLITDSKDEINKVDVILTIANVDEVDKELNNLTTKIISFTLPSYIAIPYHQTVDLYLRVKYEDSPTFNYQNNVLVGDYTINQNFIAYLELYSVD